MRTGLAELEKELDAFFRQPQDRGPLATVPGRFSQMRGVLSVLGLDHAVQAVGAMRGAVQAILLSPPSGPPAGVERPGNNVGALGLLVDMLGYQPALARKLFVFDAEAGELRPVMGRVSAPPVAVPEPEPPLEEALAEALPELADLPGLVHAPEEAEPSTEPPGLEAEVPAQVPGDPTPEPWMREGVEAIEVHEVDEIQVNESREIGLATRELLVGRQRPQLRPAVGVRSLANRADGFQSQRYVGIDEQAR